ncbi:MAG: aconitate hydratase AcnA [Brevinematales bacterium]|nr:aconitate hydratase AcnA [Brevinematales bacterium]
MKEIKGIKFESIHDYISREELLKKPFSIRVLIENVSRNLKEEGMEERFLNALINWKGHVEYKDEIGFKPCRVLMQDFTGVPIVVDLALMREKAKEKGKDPKLINPRVPTHLIVDHSLQIDFFGTSDSLKKNLELEFQRNLERYKLLKWAQKNFSNFYVVPPGKGIIHQINLEYLAKVVIVEDGTAKYDTLVGTDSHTTMINGLGVLGWGVGGIEAEAVMLGHPYFMKLPEVIGIHLKGRLREEVNATDLVLTITNLLRKVGVVDKFVEFFGEGTREMDVETRATIANMVPEYGATMGFFGVDEQTLDYLKRTGRDKELIEIVELYTKEQELWVYKDSYEKIEFSQVIEFDLSKVEPVLAGPKRPQDKVSLYSVASEFQNYLSQTKQSTTEENSLNDGDIVISSITSCTNTSNPYLLVGAGLVAKKAVEKGLSVKPYVKTSFAPGSRVAEDYLKKLGLLEYLEKIGYNIVGYGCATCIGNSGPLIDWVEKEIKEKNLLVVSILSGNRNFEGRIHPLVKANYLASPILVVAYGIAGKININLSSEPIGYDKNNNPVYFKDILPTHSEIVEYLNKINTTQSFIENYKDIFKGTEDWENIEISEGELFEWDINSTYIKRPPYLDNYDKEENNLNDIIGARVLLVLGDSITTDHISPAGSISPTSPAGIYLLSKGVKKEEFNSYGARRGNYEVMMRGTFANVRIKNLMLNGKEGGYTLVYKDGKWIETTVFEASVYYQQNNIPLIVIGGKEYGTGSSRDWAAKGPYLLGIKAIIAESFERIHRNNLIGMGIIPLQFIDENRETLGITGKEIFNIRGISNIKPRDIIEAEIIREDGTKKTFKVICRIDTTNELNILKSGGILHKALRQVL